MTDPGECAIGAEAGTAEPAARASEADAGDADAPGVEAGDGDRAGSDGDGDGDAVEPAIRPIDDAGPDGQGRGSTGRARGDAPGPGPGPGPDGDRRTLDPRIRLVWLARALVGALAVTGLALVVGVTVLDGALWLPAGTFLVVGAGAAWFARARYRRWSYVLRTDSLLLDRGVVTRVRTVVPYVRIQHVDTRRGPVERALGLGSVVVYTAGSRGADVTVPGLTRERAEELQARLERIAIRADGEDAV